MTRLSSRRRFLSAGASALGLALTRDLRSEPRASIHGEAQASAAVSFPKGFHWGAATASYQVDGG